MKRVAVCMPEDSNAPAKKYTRRNSIKSSAIEQCFFCGVSANMSEPLHQVSTLGLDARVRQCALQLQDQGLLAKMSAGDLVAQEAKYHAQCLASLYNRAKQASLTTELLIEFRRVYFFAGALLSSGIHTATLFIARLSLVLLYSNRQLSCHLESELCTCACQMYK